MNYKQIPNFTTLPRHPIKYDWFDLNTANIRLSSQLRKNKEGRLSSSGRMTNTVEGQFLKHDAYFLSSIDDENKLNTIAARLSKRDENGGLLGALRAYEYQLGDVNITDLSLTGDAGQEFGFRVSNAPFNNFELQASDINGNAIPGWDVELYQNGILTSSLTVDEVGFYEFSDVQLFSGDNLFELFFYGPQGEVRQKEINIPITAERLSAKKGSYDVSVSLSDTRTFQDNVIEDESKGTPHIVARYDKSFGNTLSYVGLRHRQVAGDNKTFLGTGFSHIFKNALLDGNFSFDKRLKKSGQISFRKKIKDWNWSLRGFAQDKDFEVSDADLPKVLTVNSSVQKSFVPIEGTRANLSASAEYSRIKNEGKLYTGSLGTSFQKNRYNIGNTLFYQRDVDPLGGGQTRLNNTLSFRGSFKKSFLRTGLTYNFEPDSSIDNIFAQANYYYSNDLSAEALFERQPERDFNRFRLGLNYVNDYFRTSPFVEIDSDNSFVAGLNVSFNLVDTPEKRLPVKKVQGEGLYHHLFILIKMETMCLITKTKYYLMFRLRA